MCTHNNNVYERKENKMKTTRGVFEIKKQNRNSRQGKREYNKCVCALENYIIVTQKE